MTAPGGSFDTAVIGAGPNGLTAAAYLARAGAAVAVCERRFERGGTFASDDYSTPFTYNLAQEALPLGAELPAVAELGLDRHGVTFIEPEAAVEVVTPQGSKLIGRGGAGLSAEIEAMLAAVSRACPPVLFAVPEPEDAVLGRWDAAGEKAAVQLANSTPGSLAGQAGDEAAALAVRWACLAAGFADPGQPLGPVGGFAVARLFSPVLVAGGTKNLANALFRVAAAAGADCRVSAGVVRVCRGPAGFRLALADGTELAARSVISTLDPAATFDELPGPGLVPPALAAAARGWRHDQVAPFIAHYGIRGRPPRAAPGPEPYLWLAGFRGVADLDAQLAAVAAGHLPDSPAGALTVPTVHDPLQASPGPFGPLHTLRFETFAPLRHPAGQWSRLRPGYREHCWRFLRQQLPALEPATLLAQFADAPGDLARRFGTTRGGTVRQGALGSEQTLTRRPHRDCATTRTPVEGLYLGGGSVHPGIPGLLSAGRLAAHAVLADLGAGP